MDFYGVLDQVATLLQKRKRVTYGALKLQFKLDDDQLQVLKEELIEAQRIAVDEDGKMLVWVGEHSLESSVRSLESKTAAFPDPRHETLDPRPIDYTPPHLADRIRAVAVTEGERKTITALFADLKGSTALIEGLDPEDARAIIDPALQLMMDAVHRYDGYVAQALGDGIFALFGAPIAHEDHPQRALYAALRMQEEMRRYSDKLREEGAAPLQMRVGVNTGEVVVRSIRKDDLHTDYVPVGHSTNLAARMEQLANPGSIVVTEYTRKLTEEYFELKALGAADIKGVEEPLNVYEVVGAGLLRTRLQVSARRGLTRFVGRQSELDQLQHALAQAKASHGQIVGVMGEPGLGKSRLFHEFKLTAQSGCLVLEAFSVSHGKASPYLPLIELLKTYFQIEPTDDERQRQSKIMGQVLTLDRSLEETLPYFFSLLSIDDPDSSLQQMDAQIRRQRTFEALKKLLLRESLNQPLLLVFEDLHWIDGETQGFLDTLIESIASAQVLLLVNYRPEYRHKWGQKTYYTQLRLAPLGQEEAEELLDVLLGSPVGADRRVGPQGSGASKGPGAHLGAPLQALKHLILDKTQGTPFFIEELVETLVEEGALRGERGHYRLETPLTELHISPTVQGVLAARIDRLTTEEKALLQQLAVIGRQFPLSLATQVVQQPEDERYRLLSSLQTKEFLYEQPAFPESEYVFKHALTQEVAYGTVLHEQRKVLHEQTGQALEALYSEKLDEQYSTLAYHYGRSGNTEKAVEYLQLAGQQAAQRSAHAEAIDYFTAVIERISTLPGTPTRVHQELALQIMLGTSLQIAKGWAAPEVEPVYARALKLCQCTPDKAQRFWVLMGVFAFRFVRAQHAAANELGQQLFALAHTMRDATCLVAAHYALMFSSFLMGDLSAAQDHGEHLVTLYTPEHQQTYVSLYGVDFSTIGQSGFAWTLWTRGYPEQARQRSTEALRRARETAHPFSLAQTMSFGTFIPPYCRDGKRVQEHAEAALRFSTEYGFPEPLAAAKLFRGWALAEQGQSEAGILQMRQGLDAWRASGTENSLTHFLGLLAEVYGKTGQAQAGLSTLAEAQAVVRRTDERWYEAELHRIKGELLLQQSQEQQSEAEACFQQALKIARHQQAKSWELRAATSLARLWQRQSKTTEARALLAPVYNWFTEGFDTADLQDAKALLVELSEGQ